MSASSRSLWCRRDADGDIVALTRESMTDDQARASGWEPAQPQDPTVSSFLQDTASPSTHLSLTDAGMGRVTEDLIDVLIDRGVIQFTDLPLPAQAKLLERRRSRAEVAHRLDLVADDDSDNGPLL